MFIKKLLNLRYLFLYFSFLLLVGGFVLYSSKFLNIESDEGYILLVKDGDNLKKIVSKLSADRVIDDEFLVYTLARAVAFNIRVDIGEYKLEKGSDVFDLIKKLKHKKYFYRNLTLIEGETVASFREKLDGSFGLIGNITEEMKDGFFMPDTYKYKYGETKDSMIKRAKDSMNLYVNEMWRNYVVNAGLQDKFYLKDVNEVLTLASIVEKETGVGFERGLIAGVFKNRLQTGMRLQTDPTVIYQVTNGVYKLNRSLTKEDLEVDGPYNTYKIFGLPPAPIANPGRDAIKAVFEPTVTDSLYFVANGDGGHSFAATLEEHNKNASEYKEKMGIVDVAPAEKAKETKDVKGKGAKAGKYDNMKSSVKSISKQKEPKKKEVNKSSAKKKQAAN